MATPGFDEPRIASGPFSSYVLDNAFDEMFDAERRDAETVAAMKAARRGELVNFVGVVEREGWPVESWTERGTRQECIDCFAGWNDEVHAIIDSLDVPYKWALLGRHPLDHFCAGSVCVIGDAAHPTLPFLAQGANMAIEDGMLLARCLDQFSGAEALRRYEAARMVRTTTIVVRSAENATRFHNAALANADGAADYVAREWQPERVRERYDWLFEYDTLTSPV